MRGAPPRRRAAARAACCAAFCCWLPPRAAAQTCICDGISGMPKTGPDCAGSKEACASCSAGYEFWPAGSEICRENVCVCDYGTPASGEDCPGHDAYKCELCASGYHIYSASTDPGVPAQVGRCINNTCTCDGGTPARGPACEEHGSMACAPHTCESGYHPEKDDFGDEECVENPYCETLIDNPTLTHRVCGDRWEFLPSTATAARCAGGMCTRADRLTCCKPARCDSAAVHKLAAPLYAIHHVVPPTTHAAHANDRGHDPNDHTDALSACDTGNKAPCALNCTEGKHYFGAPELFCIRTGVWALRDPAFPARSPACQGRATCQSIARNRTACGHRYIYNESASTRYCTQDAFVAALDRDVCCYHELLPVVSQMTNQVLPDGQRVLSTIVEQQDHSFARACSGFAAMPTTAAQQNWRELLANLTNMHPTQVVNLSRAETAAERALVCDSAPSGCSSVVCVNFATYPSHAMDGDAAVASIDEGVADNSMYVVFGLLAVIIVVSFGVYTHVTSKGQKKLELADKVAQAAFRQYDTLRDRKLNEAEFFAFASGIASLAFFRRGDASEPSRISRAQSDEIFRTLAPKEHPGSITIVELRHACKKAPGAELRRAAGMLGVQISTEDAELHPLKSLGDAAARPSADGGGSAEGGKASPRLAPTANAPH